MLSTKQATVMRAWRTGDALWVAWLAGGGGRGKPVKSPPATDSGVRETPWRRKRQHTPVFLPGKSHGQRRLASYSPWGGKELDTTEQLNNNKGSAHVGEGRAKDYRGRGQSSMATSQEMLAATRRPKRQGTCCSLTFWRQHRPC